MASGASKSLNAFRTISEVADSMGIPQHVLRFWESKFTQICPMKRGGGRRYYRPEDVNILEAIRKLLHEDGYTIKGAQKYLREQGVTNVLQAFKVKNENIQDTSEKKLESKTRTSPENKSLIITEEADIVPTLRILRKRLEKIRKNLKKGRS